METPHDNQLDAFDGELLHPSLDIKDGVLVIGFRYRVRPQEEKTMFVIATNDILQIDYGESVTVKDRPYYFETRGRKLARIEERWGLPGLKDYFEKFGSLKQERQSPKAIFEEIVGLLQRYTELDQEIDYYLLAAWILGTYFYPAFYAYPFLHVKAPKRSGKSQCLNVLGELCYNAVKARPSLAALGDTVDALRGTYLIDQADSLERKGNEELLDVLADSYKKSGGKRRVVNFDKRKGGREVLEFETYSPKAFASIKELPEDLRDRCWVVALVRSQRNFADPDESSENWREIRGKIYKCLIENFSGVNSHYTVKKIEYTNTGEIIGRRLELWLPFEVILECFGLPERVAEAKRRFLAQYGYSEYEPSELEEAVAKAILSRLQDVSEVVLSPKEISEDIGDEYFHPADTPKQRASKVGWAVKKFNLSTEKKPRTKDGVQYLFSKSKVESVFQGYFKSLTEPTSPTPADSQGLDIEEIMV